MLLIHVPVDSLWGTQLPYLLLKWLKNAVNKEGNTWEQCNEFSWILQLQRFSKKAKSYLIFLPFLVVTIPFIVSKINI